MDSPVLPGEWQEPEENPEIPNHAALARDQPNWGEIAGIAIAAAVSTVAFLGIAFFVFRWIRRFFAPVAQPAPQIMLPPPDHLLPPPPLPHVLQWLMQHGGNGGGHDMEAPPPPEHQPQPPPPAHQIPPPPPAHQPPPLPPPPIEWVVPNGGHDEEYPYPPPPPPPPIHWIMAHGEDGGVEVGGGGEEVGGDGDDSASSLNVHIGDFEDVDAESVGSSSFIAGGPAGSA
ncbi:hypothetical protein PR202_ga07841 [Eleusine coracana subsp. coracana]|uniref:Uncharacterized protein n=1 Tax=Eleusine coracana subsp. coracana TaxID=191504 RepID=A0AAV5BZP5_ELECO|nr:hypothetical protein PR202_ga07841 [Eleusine coracana subsp. coracana]